MERAVAADPNVIVNSPVSISDKIRALAEAGYARADIARLLGKRYQHVRNVLEDDARKSRLGQGFAESRPDRDPGEAGPGMRDEATPFAGPSTEDHVERVRLDTEGRLLLTQNLIEALGARPGEWVIATVREDGTIALLSARAAMKQAQAIIRRFVPAGVSLVEELLAERRAEAERENRGE